MKKWIVVLLVALIAGGVFWFSRDSNKTAKTNESEGSNVNQTELAQHTVFNFENGEWFCGDKKVEDFDEALMEEDGSMVEFRASGDVEMRHFEEVLLSFKLCNDLVLKFTDTKSRESVVFEEISQEDRENMEEAMVKHYESPDDSKNEVIFSCVAGDVLAGHFPSHQYSYANLDGRGMKRFKNAFEKCESGYMGLASLKETKLSQFIEGGKIYASFRKKVVPLVSNEFVFFVVLNEPRIVQSEDLDGNVVYADENKRKEHYWPKREDFPEIVDVPQVPEMNIVERDLPMTIPLRQPSDAMAIEPMLISVFADGSVKVNLKEAMNLKELEQKLHALQQKSQKNGSTPVIQIAVDSNVAQQQVVNVLNLIRGAGIKTVTFKDSSKDEQGENQKTPQVLPGALPVPDGLDPEVKPNVKYRKVEGQPGMDPLVKPSIAYNAVSADEKKGRIIINVRGDGTFSQEDFNKVMKTSADIQAYVEESVAKFKKQDPNIVPKIHLRGNDNALFRHSQMVMKAAAKAGVDIIVFSVFPFKEKK